MVKLRQGDELFGGDGFFDVGTDDDGREGAQAVPTADRAEALRKSIQLSVGTPLDMT